MELQNTGVGEKAALKVQRLNEEYLDAAVELCDRCVGKHLYPRAYLASMIEKLGHCFYLLITPEGEAAGYIYFFLAGLEEMAALAKLPGQRLAGISPQKEPVLGNLQSIGVAQHWRGRGLSKTLVGLYLEQLERWASADAAFGVFWRPNGHVPMEKTLKAMGFLHLCDVHRVWYDNEALICPYCKGRCECDGAVYYKPIRKGAKP